MIRYIFDMKIEDIISEIVKIIRNFLPVNYKIFLFGSWAKGNAMETSDIDIAILGETEIPWNIMVKIKQEVDDIPTLRQVDIVDLNSKEIEFKRNVLNYAKVI